MSRLREIKFRAWDKFEIMMSYDATLYANGWFEVVFPDGYESKYTPTSGLKVMQYTGLTDKNGTEIYEGDIVVNTGMWTLHSTRILQYSKAMYGKGEVFVVHHNVTGFELRHIDDWNANTTKEFAPNGHNKKPYVDNYDFWNLQKTLEVIGNIYENSDLLETNQ